MADITIAPSTQAHTFIWTETSIERDLSDHFSFIVPGSEYMQKLKKHRWDGRVRLYSRITKLIPAGLIPRVMKWAAAQGYTVENRCPSHASNWTELGTEALLASHTLPFEIRDYQRTAITYAMHQQRGVLVSPTGSGKSLILYLLIRARMTHGPILLIVPTISLVAQMFTDFESYGWKNASDSIHCITGGKPKDTDKPVVCSTWQSVFRQPEAWFSRYTTVLGDEAHLFKAKSLSGIMNMIPHCAFRIGVTGTLDDTKANSLMVEGVFGPPFQVAKTADLQTQGHLTPIIIQGHFLEYGKKTRWSIKEYHRRYVDEIDYLIQHPGRMNWLVNFVERLPGNVLVLYQFVEKHGIPLYHAIKKKIGNSRPVYFISGDVSGENRERARALLEQAEHVVLDFGGEPIRCVKDELVPLVGGGSKPARDLTLEDDVDNAWILNTGIRGMPTIVSTPETAILG